MNTEAANYLVDVPERLLPIFGRPGPGARMYRTAANAEHWAIWPDALVKACPDGLVSPGVFGMFARVSRAAVHKAMKEGRLTAFIFHEVEERRTHFGTKRPHRKNPFIYIPVIECMGWGKQLELQYPPDHELERNNPHWYGTEIEGGLKEFRRRKPKHSGRRNAESGTATGESHVHRHADRNRHHPKIP
jgi:hypothetical protein